MTQENSKSTQTTNQKNMTINKDICLSYIKYMKKEMIPKECYKILDDLKYSGLSGSTLQRRHTVKRAQLHRRDTSTKDTSTKTKDK